MSFDEPDDEPNVDELERRSASRETVLCNAWIDLGEGAEFRKCVISDVSASGARLAVAPDMKLPGEFKIALSSDGRVRRRCKIVWREGATVGVHYLARPTWDFTV